MRSPWIWQGNDARLLPSGTLLDSTGAAFSFGGGNSFGTIQCDAGTSPVADQSNDTLTFTSTDLTITGTAASDTVSWAIAANAVTNAKMATMAANTVKANVTAGSAVPTDVGLVNANTASTVPIRDANGLIKVNTQGDINTQTGSTYTLLASDCGKTLVFNRSTSMTISCPVLTAGFWCNVIQKGTGQVIFSPSSTTINNYSSQTKLAGQFAVGTIFYEATNVLYLAGQTSA